MEDPKSIFERRMFEGEPLEGLTGYLSRDLEKYFETTDEVEKVNWVAAYCTYGNSSSYLNALGDVLVTRLLSSGRLSLEAEGNFDVLEGIACFNLFYADALRTHFTHREDAEQYLQDVCLSRGIKAEVKQAF